MLLSTAAAYAAIMATLAIMALLVQKGTLKEENVRIMTILSALSGGAVLVLLCRKVKGYGRLFCMGFPAALLLTAAWLVNVREGRASLPVLNVVCMLLPSAAALVPAKGKNSGRRRKRRNRR